MILLVLLAHDGQWKTSNSKPVDFSDVPNFDQNVGEPGTTILWILGNHGSPILFPIPSDISSDISSNKPLIFYPICSAAAMVKGKHLVITKLYIMVYTYLVSYLILGFF